MVASGRGGARTLEGFKRAAELVPGRSQVGASAPKSPAHSEYRPRLIRHPLLACHRTTVCPRPQDEGEEHAEGVTAHGGLSAREVAKAMLSHSGALRSRLHELPESDGVLVEERMVKHMAEFKTRVVLLVVPTGVSARQAISTDSRRVSLLAFVRLRLAPLSSVRRRRTPSWREGAASEVSRVLTCAYYRRPMAA